MGERKENKTAWLKNVGRRVQEINLLLFIGFLASHKSNPSTWMVIVRHCFPFILQLSPASIFAKHKKLYTILCGRKWHLYDTHWFVLNYLIAWLISLCFLAFVSFASSCFLIEFIFLSLISLEDSIKKINTNWNLHDRVPLELHYPPTPKATWTQKAPISGCEKIIKHSHCLLKSRVRKINFTLLFIIKPGWRKEQEES